MVRYLVCTTIIGCSGKFPENGVHIDAAIILFKIMDKYEMRIKK